MKSAYLIIAHNEFEILQILVSRLDDPEVDIFIHFDGKVEELPRIKAEKSRLTILEKRVDVRWGSVSQIKCELTLFEEASKSGPYDYYHLISGVHLPLKPISDIKSFFKAADGKSVLTGLCKDQPYQEKLKVRCYNFFLKNYHWKRNLMRDFCLYLSLVLVLLIL